MSDSEQNPDVLAAIDFLDRFLGQNPRNLCSIKPEGGLTARTFAHDDTCGVEIFVSRRMQNENQYFHVNVLSTDVSNIKAKKEHVEKALVVHVDIDDPTGIERLAAFQIPPTAVVASGHGFHGYWKFVDPVNDLKRVEEINKVLVELLGGDSAVTDVSRIMRLVGTLNLPNKKKREAGRTVKTSYLIDELTDWKRLYQLSDFEEFRLPETKVGSGNAAVDSRIDTVSDVKPVEIPEALSRRIKAVVQNGDDSNRPRHKKKPRYPSRSEAVFAVACAMARLDCSVVEIAGVLSNSRYGISQSILEKKYPIKEALRQAEKAVLATGDHWPDGVNEKTKAPHSTMQNTKTALLRTEVSFWFDEFRQRNFVHGRMIQAFAGDLTDRAALFLRDWIARVYRFDPGNQTVRDAIEQLCSENAYDPVVEYLASLEWDGTERIEHWLIDHADAEDSAYVRAVSKIMLVAAVRRARQPGVKFDTIPVLEGIQGSGKSTIIRKMASDEFFSDQDILAADVKTQMEALEGVWLFELCELAGMRHTDVNKVKAFASRAVDIARPAYGRYTVRRHRRGILVGTTNDDQYLKDETGNRRFWPVRTGEIDLETIADLRDQLWAEAAHYEAKGEPIELDRSLWHIASIEQQKRVEDDGWEGLLEELRGTIRSGRATVSSRWVLETYLNIPPGKIARHHWKRLAKTMNALGWTGPDLLALQNGRKVRGYWRDTDLPDSALDEDIF
jgi:hypothetical protein